MTAIYSLSSVILVSLISFIGALALVLNPDFLKKILIMLVSFAAGALIGDAFIHLIPAAIEELNGYDISLALLLLSGIFVFFVVEKIILVRHCHWAGQSGHEECRTAIKPFAINNIIADGLHNFLDGVIIAASFLASPALGLTTSLAVVLHEIPQELGDFGILVHGGYKPAKALLLNFLTALAGVSGAIVILLIGLKYAGISTYLLAFTAGSFIYIAAADLIPQLHKKTRIQDIIIQSVFLVFGIAVMYLLLFLE